jgi:hypothetical protein
MWRMHSVHLADVEALLPAWSYHRASVEVLCVYICCSKNDKYRIAQLNRSRRAGCIAPAPAMRLRSEAAGAAKRDRVRAWRPENVISGRSTFRRRKGVFARFHDFRRRRPCFDKN